MFDRKREIFVQIENPKEVSLLLKEIRDRIEKTKKLFGQYEELNSKENEIFDNWGNYIEEFSDKIEHITL